MPLVNRTFDQLIDFTRTTSGTYTNSSGFITSTPASVNLLTFTEEFANAAWTKNAASAYPFDPATAPLSANVIQNGDFSSGASWSLLATPPATATIAGGKLTLVSPAGESAAANQSTLKLGSWYKVTGTVVVRSGTVKVICGGPTEFYFSATQTFTFYTQATGNTTFSLSRQTACDADFDDIVVQEITVGIPAPNGTATADALVATVGTAAHNCQQTAGGSGTPLAMSVYVKAGTNSFVQFWHGASVQMYANFNVSAGTVGTVGSSATASITSVGNGWYRCTMVFTPSASGTIRIALITSGTAAYNESWTAAGTETIFIWGAQLELGSTATEYTRNYGGRFPPRFDYDPVTLQPRGLLIEEQRTNLLTYSEDFAVWGASSVTVAANTTVAPDGQISADTLTASATSGYVSRTAAFTGDGDKSYSVFLKAGTSTTTRLTLRDTTVSVNRGSVDITWTAGVASGVATVGTLQGIDSFGNGWYRVRMLATGVVAANTNQFRFSPDLSAGTGTSIMWGAQTENGAFSTSYIPTVASQVTRSADAAAINAPNFASWYNQSEGTFVIEARSGTALISPNTMVVSNGTNNERIMPFYFNGSGQGASFVADGNVTQANVTYGASAANTLYKAAFAYQVNDFAGSVNGGAIQSDASGTLPTVDRLWIGSLNGSSTTEWNGHIRSIRYYPVRLSNAQLQALTA